MRPLKLLVTMLAACAVQTARPAPAQTCEQILDALGSGPGYSDALAALLAKKPNVNCQDGAPLIRAVQDINGPAVGALLRLGADPNARMLGEIPVLTGFLKLRSIYDKLNRIDQQSRAPSEAIVRMLVEAGATVSTRDDDGATAICFAARWGSEPTVRYLLERGADPLVRDNAGRTALVYAARGGSAPIARLLLGRGVSVNERPNDSESALMVAAESRARSVVRVLVEAGADVRLRAPGGQTPLILAAEANDTASVDLLLAAGADANSQTGAAGGEVRVGLVDIRTPLMLAAERGNQAMVRLLLRAGARALTRSEDGMAASDYAARSNHLAARQLLLVAEEREYSPVAEHVMDEEIALAALQHIARSVAEPAQDALPRELLRRIEASAAAMKTGWGRTVNRREAFAWTLTRLTKAFEWAVHVKDRDLVTAIADDLAVKRRDCDARPERRFGAVTISVRTLAGNNVERPGLRVRYMEGFFHKLLEKRPDLASHWREFSRVSAIVDEPLAAGDYAIVAWADGKAISEAKPISIGATLSRRFDIVVH